MELFGGGSYGPLTSHGDSRLRRPIIVGVVLLAAVAGALAGGAELVWHAHIFGGRVGFPLDLEWMEGGMLVHAQRIAHGLPIYQAPSLDFIPFLYTPLYPALLALLSKIVPLGYVLARAVSLIAFAGSLGLLVWAALRQLGGDRPFGAGANLRSSGATLMGVAGAGVVAAGFSFSGAFYDLARSDSLLLFFEALALFAAALGRSKASAVVAGVSIAFAFFTKQTASLIGISIGLGLLVADWRRALTYGGVAAGALLVGVLGLTLGSGSWFWTYVFKLHQSHAFNRNLAFAVTPLKIWQHLGPVLVALVAATVGLAIARKLRRSDVILWTGALGGSLAACIGFGTQWAFENAYIPAVYFPTFAAAVLGARIVAHALQSERLPAALLACVCASALAIENSKIGRPDAGRLVPGPSDRAAATRFIERLRGLPGDGFIPFHPYYSALVGKRLFVHRMGVMDVGPLIGRPAGLDQAIAERKFPFVILDWKSQPGEWPHLDARYHSVHEFREGVDTVRSYSGAQTWPSQLLLPTRDPPPLPPRGSKVADFESGLWGGVDAERGCLRRGAGPGARGSIWPLCRRLFSLRLVRRRDPALTSPHARSIDVALFAARSPRPGPARSSAGRPRNRARGLTRRRDERDHLVGERPRQTPGDHRDRGSLRERRPQRRRDSGLLTAVTFARTR
jgi:hypothetical protein